MGQRIDLALVERGQCASRTQAQNLIQQGKVWLGHGDHKIAVTKPSHKVELFEEISLLLDESDRFVSRGGLKLLGALKQTQLDVKGYKCLDLGQSTGGFTDCLIQHGAQCVCGLDVGHGQLHPALKENPQVYAFEGINLNGADASSLLGLFEKNAPNALPFNLVVADLSFIGLSKVIHVIAGLMPSGAYGMFLVKPQFELGPQAIGKNGLVKNLPDHLPELARNMTKRNEECGLKVNDFFPCSIKGGDGNQEYFVFVQKQ